MNIKSNNTIHKSRKTKKIKQIKQIKKKKIIILTSAVCRPIIHTECFNKYLLENLENINNKYDIKWIINIDNTIKCRSSSESTKNNFKKIFDDYNIKYQFILTQKPSYLNSCKNLVNDALKIATHDSCILILQDDFILTKKLDLNNIITKYLVKNSYISLVFNKFCTFPPSIIGYNILLHYVRIFNKKYNDLTFQKSGMDFLTRAYFRESSIKKNIHINYFLINNDIDDLKKLLSKKDIVISSQNINNKKIVNTFGNTSFTCDEAKQNIKNKLFLITNTNLITKEMKESIQSCSEKKINIISYNEFEKIKHEKFCYSFIRFKGIHTYFDDNCKINYNNTYFKDNGRPENTHTLYSSLNNYTMTPKKLDHLLRKNNVILTEYKYQNKTGNRKYIKTFYDSLVKFNLKCIIFYSILDKKFITDYETENIKFIKYNEEKYKNKSQIYLYYDFLKKKKYDNIILCDLSNIEFVTNPFITFNYKKNLLYLINSHTNNNNKEQIKNNNFRRKVIRLYGHFEHFSNIRNKYILSNDFIGGKYDMITEFCIKIIDNFNNNYKINTENILSINDIDIILYNYVIYTDNNFKKRIIKGIYKPYSCRYYFNKNIDYIFKKKINNEYNKIHWE